LKKITVILLFLTLVGCSNLYTVKEGDTIYSIALKKDVSITKLKEYNNLKTDLVVPGQKLALTMDSRKADIIKDNMKLEKELIERLGDYYVVRKSDTIGTIAKKYRVSIVTLMELNNLKSSKILVGQKIYLGKKIPKALSKKEYLRSFRVPLNKMKVTSKFGYRFHPVLKKRKLHKGVDLKAPMNTPLYAPIGGIVTYSGWASGYGKYIKIKHKHGYETRYGHLNKLLVKTGTKVKKGQVIAKTGNTGRSTGPHLHYEVRDRGKPLDPMKIKN